MTPQSHYLCFASGFERGEHGALEQGRPARCSHGQQLIMSYDRRFKPIVIALSELAWARVEAAVWARLDRRRCARRGPALRRRSNCCNRFPRSAH